ncbi:MAG: ATP-grasp domain-containing protein [Candidatus Acidiferrales bacterium]
MKPTVLVATTSRWFPTARMAMALANTGFTVEALCPSRHPLTKTNASHRIHTYHGLAPLVSFSSAINTAKPDLIIPCDDRTTQQLHQLYQREWLSRGKENPTCALIERSLGTRSSFPLMDARTDSMNIAEEEGVRIPKTGVISGTNDIRQWVERIGFPMVLKANRTSGGDGVRIVHTFEEACRAFRMLQAPPLLARAVKRAVIDQDMTLVWPSLLRRRSVVNAQAFVPGHEATSAIACWNGNVLASLHFEVLKKLSPTGPATVVRLIENADMSNAAEKIVRRLKLSGLHGFDFMLEAHTENAYLIEMNPRATQVGHLTLGSGRDLPAALYAAVARQSIQEAPKVTENDTIALFPQEWIRNSESTFLRSGYHDVPWEEPELIRACIRARRKQRAWYSQREPVCAASAAHLPRL